MDNETLKCVKWALNDISETMAVWAKEIDTASEKRKLSYMGAVYIMENAILLASGDESRETVKTFLQSAAKLGGQHMRRLGMEPKDIWA